MFVAHSQVICSFAQHSTSLFSTFDSPASASMRHASPALSTSPHAKAAPRSTIASPSRHPPMYTPSDFERSPGLGKRRQSDLSSMQPSPEDTVRRRLSERAAGDQEGHGQDGSAARQAEGASGRIAQNGGGGISLVDQLDQALAEEDEAGPSSPIEIERNESPSPPGRPMDDGEVRDSGEQSAEDLGLDAEGKSRILLLAGS